MRERDIGHVYMGKQKYREIYNSKDYETIPNWERESMVLETRLQRIETAFSNLLRKRKELNNRRDRRRGVNKHNITSALMKREYTGGEGKDDSMMYEIPPMQKIKRY